uniref:Uncharacterized protein n=1 Tax=Oryza meridionalis TaxID=40149 RepID=A0A0E0EYP6_9ORYZ
MLHAPSPVNIRRASRAAAAGRGGRGRRKGGAPVPAAGAGGGGGGSGVDRLADAVRLIGRDVDPGVAGADILELAMAKGPMFSWLSYWPEEGRTGY